MSTALPENEHQRVEALRSYRVLDTAPEKPYDEIVRLAAHICNAPIAYVGFLDQSRVWLKARVGITATEISRVSALCFRATLDEGPMIVNDVRADQRFDNSPLVPEEPELRFYVAIPVLDSGGLAVGMLCVLDRVARDIEADHIGHLQSLAGQITTLLELRRAQGEVISLTAEIELQDRKLLEVRYELQAVDSMLRDQAVTDELTALGNRRALEKRLEEELHRATRYERPLALMMIDVDDFRQFNDRHGHPLGDEVLRKLGEILTFMVRKNDLVVRYGGEEFAVILPDTEMIDARLLAERCRTAVDRATWPNEPITVSIGVSGLQVNDQDGSELVRDADLALYEAKAGGRNCVRIAEQHGRLQRGAKLISV